MNVVSKIKVDLLKPSREKVYAKQGDSQTRRIKFVVYSGLDKWTVPNSGFEYVVQYTKPDGTSGIYTQLPDGTPAVQFYLDEENAFDIILAPQMLVVAGNVLCSVKITDNEGVDLQTFSTIIYVEASEGYNAESTNYYNVPTLSAINREIGDLRYLPTTNKSSIVSSLIELDNKASLSIDHNATDISRLQTWLNNMVAYVDVTSDFLSQDVYGDALEYIESLGDGNWQITAEESAILRLSSFNGTGGEAWRIEESFTIDGFYHKIVSVDGRVIYEVSTEENFIKINNAYTTLSESFTSSVVKTSAERFSAQVPTVGVVGEMIANAIYDLRNELQ